MQKATDRNVLERYVYHSGSWGAIETSIATLNYEFMPALFYSSLFAVTVNSHLHLSQCKGLAKVFIWWPFICLFDISCCFKEKTRCISQTYSAFTFNSSVFSFFFCPWKRFIASSFSCQSVTILIEIHFYNYMLSKGNCAWLTFSCWVAWSRFIIISLHFSVVITRIHLILLHICAFLLSVDVFTCLLLFFCVFLIAIFFKGTKYLFTRWTSFF